MTDVNFDADLLIVGGGPAGLTAAVEALAVGRTVILAESCPRLGGMSASMDVSGQSVDLGSHRLHPSASPEVMAILRRLLGDDLLVRTRNGRIRLGGAWLAFPLKPLDLLRSTPWRFGVRSAFDLLTSAFRRERSDTYAEVVRVGLGQAVLDNFYGPYATKLWGVSADELSGEVARRRIAINGPLALARKLASNTSEAPVFLYPRLGYGQIVDGLEAELRAGSEATIRLSTTVTGLQTDNNGVDVTLSDGTTSRVRRVFWTAGPQHLAPLISATPVRNTPVRNTPVRHRGMVLAYLVLDTAQYTAFDAHYFPETQTRSARISEPKNYRNGPGPSETTVLCAELACDVGDDIWKASHDTLRGWVVEDLRSNELPEPTVLDVHVERLPSVYPVLLASDEVDDLPSWASQLDRVHVFGRQGLMVADNLHHVMEMALGAVSCLVEDSETDLWNARRWQELQTVFAGNVVED